MSEWVCAGALVECLFGAVPTPLNVLPDGRTLISGRPAANISDVNILPFGTCRCPKNPLVAALGQAPCTPIIRTPWFPGSLTTLVANLPALNSTSRAFCMYGGVIEVVIPGQFQTMAP